MLLTRIRLVSLAHGCNFPSIFLDRVNLYHDRDSTRFFCLFSLYQLELSRNLLNLFIELSPLSFFLEMNYFCLLHPLPPPPLTTQRIKILKKWNKHLEISSFYTCLPKIMIRWCTVTEIWCEMEGRTDKWKNWHVEVGVPPKKWVLKQYYKH